MTREMEIKILMEDGCTKKEAQRHIEVGTVVFDDFEKNIDFYCVDLASGNEDLEEDLRLKKHGENSKAHRRLGNCRKGRWNLLYHVLFIRKR